MKPRLAWLFLLFLDLVAWAAPAPMILDADLDSDVDDVQALAVAHSLASEGYLELLGVVVTSDDPFAATCASAINHYFLRPDLPIGALKRQPVMTNRSRYTRQLSEQFPHALGSHDQAEDATILYRRLLAASEDRSVLIVTIGHLTNLRNLLQSGADEISPLTGRQLVAAKAKRWICMGGRYPEGLEANFYRPDPASTVFCVAEWPGAVSFSGGELGEKIETGGAYLRELLPIASPVRRAYELYNGFAGRASWDQTAVLMASSLGEHYFSRVGPGRCVVSTDGSNRWVAEDAGEHEYLVIRPEVDAADIARVLDDLSVRRALSAAGKR